MSYQQLRSVVSRNLCARLFSTLVCSALIVIRPFGARFGGDHAYLALTIKELVFSPQDTLAQQLEKTVLHFLLGGLVGIGLSILGKYLASLPSQDHVAARAIPAIWLSGMCFIAGFLKSKFSRLTLSARIACFIAVWMLTADVGSTQNYLPEAGNFLWITSTAAVTAFLASLLFLRWTRPQFVGDVTTALAAVRQGLEYGLREAFPDDTTDTRAPTRTRHEVDEKILKHSINLSSTYRRVSFDLWFGRVSVKALKPFLGTVEHLRRELSWGLAPRPFHSESPGVSTVPFINHSKELGYSILESMSVVQRVILVCYEQIFRSSLSDEKESLTKARARLSSALEDTRNQLRIFCDELEMKQRSEGEVGFPQKVFDDCLLAISLSQMAKETQSALNICENLILTHESSKPRIWYPRLTAVWLGVTPSAVVIEEHQADILRPGEYDGRVAGTTLPANSGETLKAISEKQVRHRTPSLKTFGPEGHQRFSLIYWFMGLPSYLWNRPKLLRIRLVLSRIVRALKHSPHLKHGFKNAAGIALLSIPAFYSPNSDVRKWFLNSKAQWLLISYLWVLETNTGATWRVAYLRISGTILGSLYAYIAFLICGSNPYGMVIMMTIAELPLSWIILNTTVSSMGVVASVTLPPILFTQYFLDFPVSVIYIVLWRSATIAGGIVAALLMNSLVFPRHCHVLFLDNVCGSLGLLSQLYMGLSRELFQAGHMFDAMDKQKTLKLELKIRNSLHRLSTLITAMNDELTLLPIPIRRYRDVLSVLQKFLDLLTGLRQVRANIPRRETVRALAPQRRDFVSCICMSLFACEQVFGARQPLPQFLPSARQALNTLDQHVEEQIRRSRIQDTNSMGLTLVYAFAEMDILGNLVDTNEELLDLTRKLFGTAAWYHEELGDSCAYTSVQHGQGFSIVHSPSTSFP